MFTLTSQYDIMNKLKHYAGLLLIVIGTAALALTRISRLSGSNALLLCGLLCIVTGIMAHIWSIKRESKY